MGNGSSLGKHLDTAGKTGALNLSDQELKKLPEKVLALTSLRTLDLSRNALKELPDALGGMEAMRQFNASLNRLPALPPTLFAGWKSLDTLNLSGNQLQMLPDISGLVKLKKLLVSGNKLRELPAGVAACAKLELLEAADNQLGTLPAGVENCGLLQELNLARNPLLMLPPELGRCKRLVIVDVSSTQLTAEALPPALFTDTAVARLWREKTAIDEATLATIPGFKDFQQREAAREAKKLDQRRGETGNVTFNDSLADASRVGGSRGYS